jgi:hypothetical protein
VLISRRVANLRQSHTDTPPDAVVHAGDATSPKMREQPDAARVLSVDNGRRTGGGPGVDSTMRMAFLAFAAVVLMVASTFGDSFGRHHHQ